MGSPAPQVRRARSLRSLGSNPRGTWSQRCCRNGRGGIRTHEAGLLPTRSPGVRLSPLGHPSKKNASGCAGGIENRQRGWDGLTCFAGSPSSLTSFARFEPTRLFRVAPQAEYRPTPLHTSQAEGVGFEPTRLFRVNALAGRRLKPLGHPSASCVVLLIGPPGLEPGIFWSRARRVANSTTGQRAYRSRVRHQGVRGSDTDHR